LNKGTALRTHKWLPTRSPQRLKRSNSAHITRKPLSIYRRQEGVDFFAIKLLFSYEAFPLSSQTKRKFYIKFELMSNILILSFYLSMCSANVELFLKTANKFYMFSNIFQTFCISHCPPIGQSVGQSVK
jgi:hypothetical protein